MTWINTNCINHFVDKPTSKIIVIAVYFFADRISHILRDLWWYYVWNVNAAIDSYSYSSPLQCRPIFVKAPPHRVWTKLCEWLSPERKSISLISRAAYTFSRAPIRVYEQFHYRKECPTPISKLNSTAVCKICQCTF